MDIKSEKIIIELNNDEAWDLAFHIKYSLKASIKSHYCRFEKRVFEEQCRKDLNMMNKLMCVCRGDDNYMEKELWDYLEEETKNATSK